MITSLKIKTTPTTKQWLGVKWRNTYAVDWRVAVCHALVFLIFDAYNCISSIVREVEKSFHFKLMTPKHHYFQRMRWEHSHSLTRISLSFVACVNVSGCLFLLLFLFVFFFSNLNSLCIRLNEWQLETYLTSTNGIMKCVGIE